MYDYKDREGKNEWNRILNDLSSAFGLLYLAEAIIKIIALGFVGHPYAYLRDLWNTADFLIVITR
jgi:hypothetical protein